jgi:hypothetical protein
MAQAAQDFGVELWEHVGNLVAADLLNSHSGNSPPPSVLPLACGATNRLTAQGPSAQITAAQTLIAKTRRLAVNFEICFEI